MAGRLILARAGLLAIFAAPAFAQGLPDPTRPAIGDNAAPSAGQAATPAASGGLQSILRRKGGKSAAIINGDLVELGGRVGESRLSEVGEDFVVLSGPGGKDRMALTPGIEKKPVPKEATVPAGKTNNKKARNSNRVNKND